MSSRDFSLQMCRREAACSTQRHHQRIRQEDSIGKESELERRVKQLEAQLKTANSRNASLIAETKNALSRLHEKEEDYVCLQACLQNNIAEFSEFKRRVVNINELQKKLYCNHTEQVESLKTSAEKDIAWLEEETSRRRAASVALRKNHDLGFKRIHRRISTGCLDTL